MTYFSATPIRFDGVSNVTATRGRNDPEVGACIAEGDEEYIYVYNTGASTLSMGHCAVLSGVTGYSVTVSSTSSSDLAVGVCKHADIAAGSYGWLMTKGFCEIEMAATSGTVAAGGLVEVSVDGAFAPQSNTTGAGFGPVGKAMEAIVSSASGAAYVKF